MRPLNPPILGDFKPSSPQSWGARGAVRGVVSTFQIPLTVQESEFQEFLQWMRKRFDVETGQLWSSILLFHSADESKAIERFFSLFQEFINQKNCREDEQELVASSIINQFWRHCSEAYSEI